MKRRVNRTPATLFSEKKLDFLRWVTSGGEQRESQPPAKKKKRALVAGGRFSFRGRKKGQDHLRGDPCPSSRKKKKRRCSASKREEKLGARGVREKGRYSTTGKERRLAADRSFSVGEKRLPRSSAGARRKGKTLSAEGKTGESPTPLSCGEKKRKTETTRPSRGKGGGEGNRLGEKKKKKTEGPGRKV